MSIAGAVLIIASVLKVHQLLTEPIISAGFWESWLFTVIQIPLEMGLGIWLVSGLFRKAGWLLSLVAFAGFIGITIAKWWTGAASCGCFGVVHVKPWITLTAIDIPLFALLAIFRPKGQSAFGGLPPPWPSAKHFFGVAIPTFFILGTIVPVLVFNKPPDVTDKYEVIKPQTWLVGKGADPNDPATKWPLLAHIDIADKISTGFVVALLYHYDCPECRQAIPQFEQINQVLSGNDIAVAFIEIPPVVSGVEPPYSPADQNPVKPDTACLSGKLDDSKKWYAKTPLTVLLKNGSCLHYWQEETPNLEQIEEKIAEH
jgi:thiol-disulfide isomerase/thioredoxin